jgi:ubiquinone/menaquinone biosynthesis C-methylase UbiE
MTHEEMVALIRGGIPKPGGVWADFGAGRGNFTRALRACIGPAATLYAVDRDAGALRSHQDAQTITADFTRPIPSLPMLDGLLIANALHWVREQETTLRQLAAYLRPAGRLLIVEYDARWPRGYIPFPVPYDRFETLATAAGFKSIQRLATRQSPSGGVDMYSARALREL